jgi:hypothetical protein
MEYRSCSFKREGNAGWVSRAFVKHAGSFEKTSVLANLFPLATGWRSEISWRRDFGNGG